MGVSRRIDLTGQRFGHLTVVRAFAVNRHRETMWLCQCDCGNQIVRRGYYLRNGGIQDCGCATWDEPKPGKNKKRQPILDSICWNCIRSAAPPAIQCSWDKALVLPDGAETRSKMTIYGEVLIVVKCPMFLSITAKEHRELLMAEREKRKEVRHGCEYRHN